MSRVVIIPSGFTDEPHIFYFTAEGEVTYTPPMYEYVTMIPTSSATELIDLFINEGREVYGYYVS